MFKYDGDNHVSNFSYKIIVEAKRFTQRNNEANDHKLCECNLKKGACTLRAHKNLAWRACKAPLTLMHLLPRPRILPHARMYTLSIISYEHRPHAHLQLPSRPRYFLLTRTTYIVTDAYAHFPSCTRTPSTHTPSVMHPDENHYLAHTQLAYRAHAYHTSYTSNRSSRVRTPFMKSPLNSSRI